MYCVYAGLSILRRARMSTSAGKALRRNPTIDHLSEVALLLAEATGGADVNLVIAGLLHDCIEDQAVTYQDDLVTLFGADIAGLVRDVTDDKALPK